MKSFKQHINEMRSGWNTTPDSSNINPLVPDQFLELSPRERNKRITRAVHKIVHPNVRPTIYNDKNKQVRRVAIKSFNNELLEPLAQELAKEGLGEWEIAYNAASRWHRQGYGYLYRKFPHD